jgi:hypothetical protein
MVYQNCKRPNDENLIGFSKQCWLHTLDKVKKRTIIEKDMALNILLSNN